MNSVISQHYQLELDDETIVMFSSNDALTSIESILSNWLSDDIQDTLSLTVYTFNEKVSHSNTTLVHFTISKSQSLKDVPSSLVAPTLSLPSSRVPTVVLS